MHAVLMPFLSVCCCSNGPDCSHTRSRQTDREAGRQALKHMQSGDTGSTYLLQGHEHRPQNCPRLFKFFSASFMSLLIWSIPSSMRSSCSDYQHIVIFPSKRTKAHEKRREEEGSCGWKEGRGVEKGNKGEETKKDIDCDKRDIRHQHHHHQHWTGKSSSLINEKVCA